MYKKIDYIFEKNANFVFICEKSVMSFSSVLLLVDELTITATFFSQCFPWIEQFFSVASRTILTWRVIRMVQISLHNQSILLGFHVQVHGLDFWIWCFFIKSNFYSKNQPGYLWFLAFWKIVFVWISAPLLKNSDCSWIMLQFFCWTFFLFNNQIYFFLRPLFSSMSLCLFGLR